MKTMTTGRAKPIRLCALILLLLGGVWGLLACSAEAPQEIPPIEPIGEEDAYGEDMTGAETEQAPGAAPTQRPAPAAPRTDSSARTAPAPSTRAAAPSRPAAAPAGMMVTVPAGTLLEIEFLDPLSSASSQVGDAFRARVMSDHYQDGKLAIPAGSVVSGTVIEAQPLKKKIGGTAKLGLDFTTLQTPSGQLAGINAMFAEKGKSETAKDAATIGGATAGGALLGRVLKKGDKKKGTVIGAIVGAAAGTAIAAKTQGEEVEILEGTVIDIELAEPVSIRTRG